MNYLQFLFCHYTFLSYFNLSVNLYTFKIFNPYTYWKSLSFTNFSFFFFSCELRVFVLYLFYFLMKLLWRVFFCLFGYKICEDFIYNHLKQLYSIHKVNTYSFSIYIMHYESQNSAHKPQMPCFISSKCPFLFKIFLSKLKCFGNRLYYFMHIVINY